MYNIINKKCDSIHACHLLSDVRSEEQLEVWKRATNAVHLDTLTATAHNEYLMLL